MGYRDCIARLVQAAGRQLSDAEVADIFERVHRAALDIKAGRAVSIKPSQQGAAVDNVVAQAAQEAAQQLMHEAAVRAKQMQLQLTRLAARMGDFNTLVGAGVRPLDAVERILTRDFSGRTNIESLEQRVAGHRAYFGRKLTATWEALGNDWLGFFQSKDKLITLVRELRGEDSGDALAKRGAKAFHDVAEEARQVFNAAGGDIGKLDDWGMPQHHSQEKVARAGRDVWVDQVLPMIDRSRYVDDAGVQWPEARVREFLGKAWDTIATNGHANTEPGPKGSGKIANRHAEHRQVHFGDAQAVIDYWDRFGEKTAAQILLDHVETMARDISFVEHLGPNPDTTFSTLRDMALRQATVADPTKTPSIEGRAAKLDKLFDYVSGRSTLTANQTLSKIADGIAHLNTAGKLGGAALASLFGDKPMMEAVSHLNNLPMFQRWRTELAVLNPLNAADRRTMQQQGLMLESVRSGLARFYEGLGSTGFTGKLANAVMRVTGMNAINELRKGSFGLSLMSAIGHELDGGVTFARLADNDVRALRNYGITEVDWNVWRLARLEDLGHGNSKVLTPESIARVSDADLQRAGILGAASTADDAAKVRRDAIVKLLGAVNTESEFAIVTPGWQERAQFYAGLAGQRGTPLGEITRSALQFKSFPWAMFQRGMNAIANADGPVSKSMMTAYLVVSTTLAGAMLMQVRDMLTGKDPRDMAGSDAWKFWGAAFLQGGALGIYGDFLYGANQTRYGSGPLEAMAGPTLGPLLELGIVQPLDAIKKNIEGKESHFLARSVQDLKGFFPGGNMWYTKAALDHLLWQNVMEMLSPGYLASIRSRTMKEYGQDWWWSPGETKPDRAPDLGAAAR
jgi:hypothetical protein